MLIEKIGKVCLVTLEIRISNILPVLYIDNWPSIYMYICVCVCVCMCVYIYTCIYIHIHIYTHIYTHTHTYIYIYIYIYIYHKTLFVVITKEKFILACNYKDIHWEKTLACSCQITSLKYVKISWTTEILYECIYIY